MKEKKTSIKWIKDHKKELILLGLTAVGTIVVIKNWDSIKGVLEGSNKIITSNENFQPIIVEKVAKSNISNEILENLTGNLLTAKNLGEKTSCSAQAINKRILVNGLATKLPNGDYSLTDSGKLLGVVTDKITKYGHSFCNIEWDEKILEILFSPEELNAIKDKKEFIKSILNNQAA